MMRRLENEWGKARGVLVSVEGEESWALGLVVGKGGSGSKKGRGFTK